MLIDQDRLALWEFDTDCDRVGEFTSNNPGEFGRLLTKLGGPRGGTAIGRALEKVGASEEGKDILLITDGQSYDLDVQRLAKSGHRIFAVLVGEGSLEAMVGHLAVLSGGDLHFSFGADVDQAIQACIEGMRQKPTQGAHCDLDEMGSPERVVTMQGNATIEASWSQAVENPHVNSEFSEAVAAYAASLAFAGAEEEWAASIAVQAGLVTHLTSLVLVAKDAQIQEELPKTIKQSLPTVQETLLYSIAPISVRHASAPDPGKYYSSIHHSRTQSLDKMDQSLSSSPLSPSILGGGDIDDNPQAQNTTLHPIFKSSPSIDWDTIVRLGKQIDWNTEGSKLARGELRGIPEDIAKEITNLAGKVADFTNQITPSRQKWALIFVITLAAYAVQGDSKWAARVYRKIIKENKMVPELSGLILMYVRWITGEWKNPESIIDRDSGK